MTNEEILNSFKRINLWQSGGQRAPHKPLLVLYAVAELVQRERGVVDYQQADERLRSLLEEFGPPRKAFHTEYPFWRLQNDGIWIVQSGDDLRPSSAADIKKSDLIRGEARGCFTPEVREPLMADRDLLQRVVGEILDENFPPSMHEDILEEVGLDLEHPVALPKRDPDFRGRVLTAYESRCAICGFDVRVGDKLVGLEAAHIKWHQAGGPSSEENGLALCCIHHKLFDRGAITVTDDYLILASQSVSGGSSRDEWVLRFYQEELGRPQSTDCVARPEYLKWHWDEVFRSPPREVRN